MVLGLNPRSYWAFFVTITRVSLSDRQNGSTVSSDVLALK